MDFNYVIFYFFWGGGEGEAEFFGGWGGGVNIPYWGILDTNVKWNTD